MGNPTAIGLSILGLVACHFEVTGRCLLEMYDVQVCASELRPADITSDAMGQVSSVNGCQAELAAYSKCLGQ